jgi:hypothetical protein
MASTYPVAEIADREFYWLLKAKQKVITPNPKYYVGRPQLSAPKSWVIPDGVYPNDPINERINN